MAAAPRTRSADPIDPLGIADCELLPLGAPQERPDTVGRVNTPPAVARWMVREALDALPPTSGSPTILEPAAGSGVIVAALAEAMTDGRTSDTVRSKALRCIWAIDADPHIRPAAEARLRTMFGSAATGRLRRRYRIGDALLDDSLLPGGSINLIIGNPPFLGARDARRLGSFDAWRERFAFRGDLYAYFMLWAMQRVCAGGVVCLLVPDTWLRLSGYESLREKVLSGRLLKVVRLPANTFDRHVLPCFFVWQKADPAGGKTQYIDARGSRRSTIAPAIARRATTGIAQSAFADAPRKIIYEPTPENRQLAARLSTAKPHGRRLSDFLRIVDAGIHSRNCRDKLFFARRERPGLKRLLQGRQIEPFAVRWDSPKARYRWVDIAYRPRPGVRGRRGDGSPSVRDEYWDWQGDPAIHALPLRILIRQTGDRIVAARCIQGRTPHYTDNTLFSAVSTSAARDAGMDERFLVAYLNSGVASRCYRFLSGESGRPQAQIKIRLLRDLPFVVPPTRDIRRITQLVDRIEAAAREGESPAPLRSQLDACFSRLFAFDDDAMLPD